MHLSHLSDEQLVSRISSLCLEGHRLTARLVEHLVEVEERRLALREGYSMFDFCTQKLGMSENEAFRRLNAARLVRRFPQLLEYIERGEICITTLERVRGLLAAENVDAVIAAVAGKSQREVREVVDRIAPRPSAPDRIVTVSAPMVQPPLCPVQPEASGLAPAHDLGPKSEDHFRIEMTISAAAKEKLERARDLMRHRNPKGELGPLFEAALDELLAKLEKERLGKTKRPRSKPGLAGGDSNGEGYVSQAARREVFARDGEQCTFVSESGHRCESRAWLELDHIVPRALGGSGEPENLRVRCRAHNRLYAEEVFGKDGVARRIERRRRAGSSNDGPVHFGQPKYAPLRADRMESEQKSPCDDAAGCEQDREAAEARARAEFGLTNLGFQRRDVLRALDVIAMRRGGARVALGLEAMIREALQVLS